MRRLLSLCLRADGFEVIEAANGGELAARIGELVLGRPAPGQEIDLIITDVRMPVSNGLDVVARLRHFDRTIPVIVITAFADDEIHHQAARLDARVFDKPFDLADLRMAALHLT